MKSPDGHVSHLDLAWGHALAAQRLAESMSEGPYHAEIDRLVEELTGLRLQRRLAGDQGKKAVGEGS